MNRGYRTFLFKTIKWILVPLMLVVVGYLFVGPFVSDYMNQSRAVKVAPKS